MRLFKQDYHRKTYVYNHRDRDPPLKPEPELTPASYRGLICHMIMPWLAIEKAGNPCQDGWIRGEFMGELAEQLYSTLG